MSQHYFQTEHNGSPVTVQLGWDRPLQRFYMSVERGQSEHREAADDDQDDGFLYTSHADLQAMSCQDMDYFVRKLKELGIEVPESMFQEARTDAALGVSNRQVVYEKDGTFAVLSVGRHHALIR